MRTLFTIILIALIFLALPFQPVAAEERHFSDLTFDFAKTTRFGGLGTQIWLGAGSSSARAAVLKKLGVRYVRLSITPDISADQLLAPQLSVEYLSAAIAKNDTAQFDSLLTQFQQLVLDLRLDVHLVFWEMPKPWRKDIGIWKGNQLKGADSDHFDDYAAWIVAQLLFVQQHGIVPKTIEFTNEPDGGWNTRYTPEQYDVMLRRLRATMDRYGLEQIGIEGPGTGKIYDAAPFLDVLQKTGDLQVLADISVHDYDTVQYPEPVGLANLPSSVKPGADGKPVFVTEFSSDIPRWSLPPYQGFNNRGGPNDPADSADFGVSVAGEALKLIGDGATAIFVWQAEEMAWGTTSHGLLDLSHKPRPIVEALAAALAGAPRDAAVTNGQTDLHDVTAVAFRRPHEMLIAVANLSSEAHEFRLKFEGFSPIPSSTHIDAQFEADGASQVDGGSNIYSKEGNIFIKIRPRSVISLICGEGR